MDKQPLIDIYDGTPVAQNEYRSNNAELGPHMPPEKNAPRPNLLTRPVKVVNVGLAGFATELATQSVPVVHVEWQPPAGGNAKLAALLAKLGS